MAEFIVIVPWFPWMDDDDPDDLITVYEERTEPQCQWCNSKNLEYLKTTRANSSLYWCDDCEEVSEFYGFHYGEDERTYTRKEYEEIKAQRRQREHLEQRYGTPNPRHIHDYWQRMNV